MANDVAAAFTDNAVIRRAVLENVAGKTRLYVVFLIARSGSTWLMELARNSGVLGTPQEWFNEGFVHMDEAVLDCRPPKMTGSLDVNDYLQRTVQDYQSSHGIMGAQLSIYQAECLCEMVEDVRQALRSITSFYLRRRNITAQAVSLYRSVNSGLFHSYQSTPELRSRFESVGYDAEAIIQWCEHLLANEIAFEQMFLRNEVQPHRFLYEDIVAAPEGVLRWMADKMGVSPEVPLAARSQALSTLSDNKTADWLRRFESENGDYLASLHERRPPLDSHLSK